MSLKIVVWKTQIKTTMRYLFTPTGVVIDLKKKKETAGADENVKKLEI